MTKRRGDGNKILTVTSSFKRGIKAALVSIVLISVFSFSVPVVAYATEEVVIDTQPTDPTTDRDSYLTGSQEERTNINPPGASEDPDDLKELNIANTVTVTYDNGNGSVNGALRILITLTLLSLAPTLLVMMTSFTRIIVALHFTRTAIGTQTSPPNLVMIGIALFMTLFIMQPTLTEAYNTAVVPLEDGQMDQSEFFETAMDPLRTFMYGQTQKKDVKLFMDIAKLETVENLDDIPNYVLIPAFVISELRTAFIIGFLIYIPFIVTSPVS